MFINLCLVVKVFKGMKIYYVIFIVNLIEWLMYFIKVKFILYFYLICIIVIVVKLKIYILSLKRDVL